MQDWKFLPGGGSSYVSKFKKFLSSSITQQLHGLPFDSPFWNVGKKEFT